MKTKQVLFAVLFFFFFLNFHAQEKISYMLIQFIPHLKNEIQISIDGKEYLEEKADYLPREKESFNVNPLFKKVKVYEDKDWEAMSFNTVPVGSSGLLSYQVYLKKKN
ncbi:MAG TPA: hypothetical protein PL029_06500, partial [Bacteroidia bacterium]|nr:hypothetical protein [Bacteroidia bacterium]